MAKVVLEIGCGVFPHAHQIDLNGEYLALDSDLTKQVNGYNLAKLQKLGLPVIKQETTSQAMKRVMKHFGTDRNVRLIAAKSSEIPLGDLSVDETHSVNLLHRLFALNQDEFNETVDEMARVTRAKIVLTQAHYGYSPIGSHQMTPNAGPRFLRKVRDAITDRLKEKGFVVEVKAGSLFQSKANVLYPKTKERIKQERTAGAFILTATRKN